MNPAAMEPYGRALLDFFNGDTEARFIIHREDEYPTELPARVFFRQSADFSPLEHMALARCRGEVLDVGAGAGCHSLALQAQGLNVWAIDVSTRAVEIMAKRGVQHVQQADVFEFQGGPFDTMLLMMHGLGMVQDLTGLDRFLDTAQRLLKPEGQILLDSADVRRTDDPRHLAYQQANRQAGRYIGEIRIRFEYKGHLGPLFGWLHVDAETLADHAQKQGWLCQVIYREAGGDYWPS